MTPEAIIALVGVCLTVAGIYLRDRELQARMDERLKQIPVEMDNALLRWEGPFRDRLNGTYMRAELIKSEFGRIDDRFDSGARRMAEMRESLAALERSDTVKLEKLGRIEVQIAELRPQK